MGRYKTTKNEILQIVSSYLQTIKIIDMMPTEEDLSQKSYEKISSYFKIKELSKEDIKSIIGDVVCDSTIDILLKEGIKKEIGLSHVPGITIKDIAKSVYKFINKFPSKYDVLFKLGKQDVKIPRTNLTKSIELHQYSKEEAVMYEPEDTLPLQSYIQKVLLNIPRIEEGNLVIRISKTGCVSKYSVINFYEEDPLYLFKTIIGLYLSLGILNYSQNKSHSLNPITEYRYLIFEKNKLFRSVTTSTEDMEFINSLKFDEKLLSLTPLEKWFKKITTQFDDANLFISKIIRQRSSDTKKIKQMSWRIKNSSYWFYEASKKIPPDVRTIFITTAIDSLLGRGTGLKSKEQKAKLISYIIGESFLDADKIENFIIKLYRIRNDIVHGKKPVYLIFPRLYGEPFEENARYILSLCLQYLKFLLRKQIIFFVKNV